MEELTKEEATQFFAEFYNGTHHIPRHGVKVIGGGWYVNHDRGDLATFDFNGLTRLVLMAHEKCIRVSIEPVRNQIMRIAIWKRQREGGMCERHPTIEQALELFNKPKTVTA